MFVTNFSQFAVGSTIEFNCISSHAKSTFDEYIVTGNIFTPGFPARMIILGIAAATGDVSWGRIYSFNDGDLYGYHHYTDSR